MLARMTVTLKLDENTSEQFTAMLQQENISLEEFKWSVQDSFGVSFISKLNELFKKVEDRIKERELAEKVKKESATNPQLQLEKPQPIVELTEQTKQNQNDKTKDGLPTSNADPVIKPSN